MIPVNYYSPTLFDLLMFVKEDLVRFFELVSCCVSLNKEQTYLDGDGYRDL